MDRRRFLKYAGTGAVVVGASALGLNYVSQQSPSTMSPTTSTTLVPKLTTTSVSLSTPTESVHLASLQGRLFFDYNGNGAQDREEPAIAGALVRLKDNTGRMVAEASTDSSGDYRIEDIGTGSYRLHIEADKKFRYMCDSPNRFAPLEEGWYVPVFQDTTVNLGLMEGFLTIPFPRPVPIRVGVGDYFDHDPGMDAIWWNGRRLPAPRPHTPPFSHDGTDFFMPKGTEVRAACSGIISEVSTALGQQWWVSVGHGYDLVTTYIHIDKPLVSVNTPVARGQPIALSGETGSRGFPHLHFDLLKWGPLRKEGTWSTRTSSYFYIDPYSPVEGVPKGAWIHEGGTLKWWPSDEEWVSQGYWTRLNAPQYSD